VSEIRNATPKRAEQLLHAALSFVIAGNDGSAVRQVCLRSGSTIAAMTAAGKEAADMVRGRDDAARSVLALVGGGGSAAPVLTSYVGLGSAPTHMAAPNSHLPISEVSQCGGGYEPPPVGNNESLVILGKLAGLEPQHVIGVAVALAYCATCQLMEEYGTADLPSADRWKAWADNRRDWAVFAAENDGCMVDGAWQTGHHAVSAFGHGLEWLMEQVVRLAEANKSVTRHKMVALVTASYVAAGSKWLGPASAPSAWALGDSTGATTPATIKHMAAMLRRVAEVCRDLLDPPEVVLAMCQSQLVMVCLKDDPPKHRINVAYFDGAHPSDLLPFSSALLVASGGDTEQFVELYNTSLPALLEMDEAADAFVAANIGTYKHAQYAGAQ